jgi:hypothetical protein
MLLSHVHRQSLGLQGKEDKIMPLRNPSTKIISSDPGSGSKAITPETAERQLKKCEEELGVFRRWRVGSKCAGQMEETILAIREKQNKAFQEIAETAIDLRTHEIKLSLVAGALNGIAALQGELQSRYHVAGEEMLLSQMVARRSLIQRRSEIRDGLRQEAQQGRLNPEEAIALMDDTDSLIAEQEARVNLLAQGAQDSLARLTLNVVQHMSDADSRLIKK